MQGDLVIQACNLLLGHEPGDVEHKQSLGDGSHRAMRAGQGVSSVLLLEITG
jgi:hypothetical protein